MVVENTFATRTVVARHLNCTSRDLASSNDILQRLSSEHDSWVDDVCGFHKALGPNPLRLLSFRVPAPFEGRKDRHFVLPLLEVCTTCITG